MVPVRRLALAACAAFYGIGAALGGDTAWACTCVAQTLAQTFDGADHVFTATTVGERSDGPGYFVWTVRVDDEQKGDVDLLEELTITHGSAACGLDLRPRARYQFFAFEDDGGVLRASSCSHPRELAGAAATPFRPEGAAASTGIPLPAVVALGGTAAIAAAAGLRRRRAR